MPISFYVVTEYSCVMTEFVLGWGFYVKTLSIFLPRPSLGQGPREFMSRHSVQCRDSGVRHCIATRLRARGRHALSQQCGVVLCRNREDHARAIDQARSARVR